MRGHDAHADMRGAHRRRAARHAGSPIVGSMLAGSLHHDSLFESSAPIRRRYWPHISSFGREAITSCRRRLLHSADYICGHATPSSRLYGPREIERGGTKEDMPPLYAPCSRAAGQSHTMRSCCHAPRRFGEAPGYRRRRRHDTACSFLAISRSAGEYYNRFHIFCATRPQKCWSRKCSFSIDRARRIQVLLSAIRRREDFDARPAASAFLVAQARQDCRRWPRCHGIRVF